MKIRWVKQVVTISPHWTLGHIQTFHSMAKENSTSSNNWCQQGYHRSRVTLRALGKSKAPDRSGQTPLAFIRRLQAGCITMVWFRRTSIPQYTDGCAFIILKFRTDNLLPTSWTRGFPCWGSRDSASPPKAKTASHSMSMARKDCLHFLDTKFLDLDEHFGRPT